MTNTGVYTPLREQAGVMSVNFAEQDDELARREVEAVSVYLARSVRLRALLEYLTSHTLAGNSEALTEYSVAIEVFGRAKETFVSSDDAIARVETHRLRKKLRLYYETEGRDHAVRIHLRPGTYVPDFEHRAGAQQQTVQPPELPLRTPEPSQPAHRTTWGRWFIAGCAVLALCAVLAWHPWQHRSRPAALAAGVPAASAGGATGVAVPYNMIAGYSGPPQLDTTGNLWVKDTYGSDGWAVQQPKVFIARTNDPTLFAYARMGDSDYSIPLAPGDYELHLYFVGISQTAQSEESEAPSISNITVNGALRLFWFDVVSDAMGRNIADERVLRDITPAADGRLHVHLSTVVGTPTISGIRILRGTPQHQLPLRIITQSTPLTDAAGNLWIPDDYYLGGRHLSHDLPVSLESSRPWLSSERYGHFSYALPVDTRDRYTLKLYFSELFFGSPGQSGVGSRLFNVLCNGQTLLENFDILKDVAPKQVDERTFTHLRPTAQGKLNVTFEPVTNYATVSALEVIDEGAAKD